MTPTTVRPGEQGSSPIEVVLGLALLVLPLAVLVVLLPTWAEHQSAARVAAQAAARVATLEPDADRAEARGAAIAAEVLANHGITGGSASAVTVAVPRGGGTGAPARGGVVRASVTVEVPLVPVPFLGPIGGFPWTASHAERIDDYRSLPAP